MTEITNKELKIINSLTRNEDASQRDISNDIGASLGLTNILINRLVKKGYLKARKLNARKIKYIITPRGLKEKTRKTYNFMKRSFSVIKKIEIIISDFAVKMRDDGKEEFIIIGEGELSDITRLVLHSLNFKSITISVKDNGPVNIDKKQAIFNTSQKNTDYPGSSELNIWKEAEKLYGSSYEL